MKLQSATGGNYPPPEPEHHADDSYMSCVICREYVPGTDEDTNRVAWPCAVVQLAALRAEAARVPEGLREAAQTVLDHHYGPANHWAVDQHRCWADLRAALATSPEGGSDD